MNLEQRIKQHFEDVVASEQPAKIEDVIGRGTRLRRRAIAGTTLLSVGGAAAVLFVTMMFTGTAQPETDLASPSPDKSLYDQVAEDWAPVPDAVDPELAAVAAELCPFDLSQVDDQAEIGMPVGEPAILAIDQRGIYARILHGVETSDGATAVNCGAIDIDGIWQSTNDLDIDLSQMTIGSGGPVPDYVAEMRLRFPDGTEVTATIGGGRYVLQYPTALHDTLTEPNSYAYMESYSKEGALISSELYMSSRDREQMQNLASLVGQPLPTFELAHIPGTASAPRQSDAKVTVMVIWTPSCAFCLDQLVVVQETAYALADEVAFLGVATQTSISEAEALLSDRGIGFPNWLAIANPDLDSMGIGAVPMTFIADNTGTVVQQLPGITSRDELAQAIASALS